MITIFRSARIRTSALRMLPLATLCFSSPSISADIQADFFMGVGFTDNMTRVATDGTDETIAQTGMTLTIDETTSRIDSDVRGTLTYYDYIDDTYDSELVGAVDALVDINLVEERVKWSFHENYGRTTFDPFFPARPENWENLSFFTTGPELVLFRRGRNDGGVELQYSALDYETRPFDNERRNARIWIGREIRRNRTLSLNADIEKVEFDNGGLTPEYARRSAYLRYEGDSGRDSFSIDAGFTEQEILSQTSDGATFNVSWTHEISPSSQLSLNLGRRFADQGNVFRYQQDITRDVDSIGDLTENGSPFQVENFNVSYSLTSERIALAARVGASEQEYELQGQLDRQDVRVNLFAQRDLTRSLFASLDMRYHKREFTRIDRKDDTAVASLALGYRLNPAFALSLRFTYITLDSGTVTNQFDERRGDLILTYTPQWAVRTGP